MKIFACSDIHGFFTIFKSSLDKADFEANNPNHLLVICGDLFDRGNEPQQLLDYLMSIKNKVLIKGNHEAMFKNLCERGFPYKTDISNGTVNTIIDLAQSEVKAFPVMCEIAYDKLKPLLDQMVDYFETEHYIFVHSFIPTKCEKSHISYYTRDDVHEYNPDWRNSNSFEWENISWVNPFILSSQGLNQTGKTIVHGHWSNSYYWSGKENRSSYNEDAKFDICEHDGCIGLDACTALSKKVHILVLEDNLLEEED